VSQWDPFALTSERLTELTEKWQLDDEAVRRLTVPLTAAVAGHLKLVRGADQAEEALYDLEADPLERSPLRDEGAMAARAGDALAELRAAVHGPAAQAVAEVSTSADELPAEEASEIERKMRLLGYL
jgi:hypothetical protein